MNTVLLAVILIPIVEIYLFIKIGSQIGAFSTIFLIFFTAVVGVYYARYEGINTLRSGMIQIIKNQIPAHELISGAAIAFAAVLLIIPGFATDLIGFLLIIPITRKLILGKFNKKFSLFETLLSGFPAGTVSGAPKIRAMEIIDELEKNKRKLYAGGIGYFTPNGEFDTCIALRTALIKNKKFYVQAGAGVVADSKPEKEYVETVNKAKALMRAVD